MKPEKASKVCMWIALISIIVSILATSLIQTDFGKVAVTKINIATPEGQKKRCSTSLHSKNSFR